MEWLVEAIESVRSQDVRTRIIVVDNGSSPAVPPLADVETVRTPSRGSVGYARSFGLQLVPPGGAVLFLDADDLLQPGSLAYLLQLLELHPGAVAAQGAQVLWYPESGEQRQDRWPYRWIRLLQRRLARRPGLLAFLFATRLCYPIHGALLQTDAVRDAGGFWEFFHGEDWALTIALALRGPMILTEHPTYTYRRHRSFIGLYGQRWGAPRHQRMIVAARIRAQVRRDPRTPLWLRSPPVTFLLWAIHHGHDSYGHLRARAKKARAALGG